MLLSQLLYHQEHYLSLRHQTLQRRERGAGVLTSLTTWLLLLPEVSSRSTSPHPLLCHLQPLEVYLFFGESSGIREWCGIRIMYVWVMIGKTFLLFSFRSRSLLLLRDCTGESEMREMGEMRRLEVVAEVVTLWSWNLLPVVMLRGSRSLHPRDRIQ